MYSMAVIVFDPCVIDCHDVRMVESTGGFGLAKKNIPELVRSCLGNLEGHVPPDRGIPCKVHGAGLPPVPECRGSGIGRLSSCFRRVPSICTPIQQKGADRSKSWVCAVGLLQETVVRQDEKVFHSSRVHRRARPSAISVDNQALITLKPLRVLRGFFVRG